VRVLVISNDVVPGFGVPVAAPGLRAAGIAEGLRSHGIEVGVSVPSGVIDPLFPTSPPTPPPQTHVVDPRELMNYIREGEFTDVVFSNSNMTPHLGPMPGVRFIFDLFAPKVLESLASINPGRPWQEIALEKERGLALADLVWVNGHRKIGYALGWLARPSVERQRTEDFGLTPFVGPELLDRVSLVEMPVVLPDSRVADQPSRESERVRLGIAGYAQQWSSLSSVHPAHQILVDAGHELHALLPAHWGGSADDTPENHLPPGTISHAGPLEFGPFAAWTRSMDAMVDVFAPSPERRFAMITRSAVALRLGVPLLHGVDSEIADIVREHDAGWVLDPDDPTAWQRAAADLRDPDVLARKRAGAQEASTQRFAPHQALAEASRVLRLPR